MSKIWWCSVVIIVANVHLSIITSFYMYQIQWIFLSPIVLIVFKKNGPIRMQYLSVCQEGADWRFYYL